MAAQMPVNVFSCPACASGNLLSAYPPAAKLGSMYFWANLGAPALSMPHSGAPTGVVVNFRSKLSDEHP
jgi:hypothetical protein